METYLPFQQSVVTISQEMTRQGYLMGTGGNVSVRVTGNAFAITPSNFDYLQMTPADVCVLDETLAPLAGERKPSIESGMHAAIYQARPDVNVVIHTHQVTASALALLGKPIPALFDEQVRFLGRSVEIVPYGPSGTGWLKSNIVRKLKNHANAYILQNHGALTLGPNAERAMFNVELLEKCATAFLLAYYTGERLTTIPLPVREIVFAKLKKEQKNVIRDV
jgi:ribulose-5-phosphate 4-epimerase/fuculose-1-phosphate aldolase